MSVRFVGRLAELSPESRALIVERARKEDDEVIEARVRAILSRVRREGDAALFALSREFDKVSLESLEVPKAKIEAALASLDHDVRRALERAAANLETVHRAFIPSVT